MQGIWSWFIARMKEPSTWAGVSLAAMAISTGLANHADWATLLGGVLSAVISEKSA